MKNITQLMPPTETERHLKSENARLQAIVDRRKRDSGQINEAMSDVLAAVGTETPPKIVIDRRPAKVESNITHVVHLTDWHIGEMVPAEHTEGFGEANYGLACSRIESLANKIIKQTDLMRNAYKVDTCHIVGTADWVSGDIHEELVRTNEFPAPVQAVNAGFLLGRFIASLAGHFENIKVDLLTAGNHDRLTRKPQSADGGLNSYGYIVTEIAKQRLKECENVECKIHIPLSTVIEVAGQRYLIAHGDGIKGTWGIPFYGIERKKQKEAMARMNMTPDKHFDKIVIGHFHTALNHEHWLIGGSLTGTNEFDHKEGRHSHPHQTAWFIHPKHGEFAWQRWWL
jgi:hypothetical protein